MTSFLALVGFLYLSFLSLKILVVTHRTVRDWKEIKKDEPEMRNDSLKDRVGNFMFLFVVTWFFLPLNAVAGLQKDEK